jgi:uncharacterized protein YecT (DUF1311 family)
MIYAVVLAVATAGPCEAAQTQQALDVCWAARAAQAEAQLNTSYARVAAAIRKQAIDTIPLAGAQRAWIAARDATCAFETSLYEGGSIAPMIDSECVDRMTRARNQRLSAMLSELAARRHAPLAPVSKSAAVENDRVYGLLYKRVTPPQQKALAASEAAWSAYRAKACKLEGGSCLTQLAQERTLELKGGWIGEPFW